MANRIKPVDIPQGYREDDFADIITKLKSKSSFGVENGRISLRVFSHGEYFERFNKKFYIRVLSVLGHVHISITEVKADRTT
jgi:hypothetical protein